MNTVSMLNAVDIIVPIFAVLGVIILLVVVIILLFLLNKKMQITNIQIPPENRKVIDGTVIKCKYLGSYTTSWGVFVNRRRPIFNVHLDIMIDDKPQRIKARVALSDEENWDSINDINSIARWFGRQKPFQIGQILAIEYDYTNPKRGNIITSHANFVEVL